MFIEWKIGFSVGMDMGQKVGVVLGKIGVGFGWVRHNFVSHLFWKY